MGTYRHGTGPKAMGSSVDRTTNLESENDMARSNQWSPRNFATMRPQSRSSLFFIGTDRRGNWVVRDQAGLCGGLFVNRSVRERTPPASGYDGPRYS